jgi:hypothetical protein
LGLSQKDQEHSVLGHIIFPLCCAIGGAGGRPTQDDSEGVGGDGAEEGAEHGSARCPPGRRLRLHHHQQRGGRD